MGKVYAPQEPMIKNLVTGMYERNARYNLDDAKRFGDLVFVWPNGSQVWNRYEVRQKALEIAQDYHEDEDWVVNVGSPTLMFLLGWALGRSNKELRVLEWDGRINEYVPIIMKRKE